MPIRSWGDLLNDAGGSGDSFDPIPAGDYDFTIAQADATQTSNGKTMYKVRAKVEAGPHADRLVFDQFVISPENPTALGIFFRQMNVLGLNREFFAGNPSDHHVAEALIGKRFRGQVQIKTWQGQERNEIKQYFTAVSGSLGNGQGMPPGPGSGSSSGIPPAPAAAPPAAAPAPAAAPPAPAAPPAAPAAPAPAPVPAYAAPAAPAAPAPPAPAATPAPEPVQQAEVPPVETPAAPPAAPAPVAAAPAPDVSVPNVPAPPPF